MNRKQLVSMWCGIVAFVVVSVFTEPETGGLRGWAVSWGNYAPFFIRWITVAVVTAGLIYTFKDSKPKDD